MSDVSCRLQAARVARAASWMSESLEGATSIACANQSRPRLTSPCSQKDSPRSMVRFADKRSASRRCSSAFRKLSSASRRCCSVRSFSTRIMVSLTARAAIAETTRTAERGHRRLVVPGPSDHAVRRRLAIGADRFVGQPPLDVPGEFRRRVVSVLGVECHRLEHDSLQGPWHLGLDLPWRREVASPDLPEHGDDLIFERRPAGQEAVERRAEAVDVAQRAEQLQAALGLLRAHIGRSPDDRARLGLTAARGARRPEGRLGRRLVGGIIAAHDLRQPPVDDQGLSVGTQHDVRRFEIAMEDPPAVGIRHRVADADEPGEELAQGQGPLAARGPGLVEAHDGLLEALAADESHGIERAALTVGAQCRKPGPRPDAPTGP